MTVEDEEEEENAEDVSIREEEGVINVMIDPPTYLLIVVN